MIKYILMSVAAAAVIGIAWPLIGSITGRSGPNEATQLVQATERTNTKAGSLNDSFTDVIPPAPRKQPPMKARSIAKSRIKCPGKCPPHPQGTGTRTQRTGNDRGDSSRNDCRNRRRRTPTLSDTGQIRPLRTGQRARGEGRD